MLKGAPSRALSTFELIAFVAAMMSLNALTIDVMLPALPDIGRDFALTNDNDRQLVIIAFVTTFGVAQLVYGALADAFGRRIVLIWALVLYFIGTLLCVAAPTFELLLAARAMQGLGSAATRVVATAVVRDTVSGQRMAQIMSMAMTVFMIVPIVAPSVGQLILFVAPWRWIFGALLIFSALVLAWTLLRLPETLKDENRTPLRLGPTFANYAAVLKHRQTLGYIIASSFITAALFGYIAVSEQIYVDVYGLGAAFPLAFGAIAIAMSFGTAGNARLVTRIGMRRMSQTSALCFAGFAALNAVLALSGFTSFWVFAPMLAVTFSVLGAMNGNFSALAMEPAGRMAGAAAALYGALTATAGSMLGAVFARLYDGTTLPFLTSLVVLGIAVFAAIAWTERGRLFQRDNPLDQRAP